MLDISQALSPVEFGARAAGGERSRSFLGTLWPLHMAEAGLTDRVARRAERAGGGIRDKASLGALDHQGAGQGQVLQGCPSRMGCVTAAALTTVRSHRTLHPWAERTRSSFVKG